MNNYDLHNKAQELADTCTPYNLAKSVVIAQEKFWAMDQLLEQLEIDLEHFHQLVAEFIGDGNES